MRQQGPFPPAAPRIPVETAAAEALPPGAVAGRIAALAARSRAIHERECFNLNPATNAMNPKAEALMAAGLGSRPSLGWPGEKYETGLEAIEEIEVHAALLAAEVFRARFAEARAPSGAMANLIAFMALAKPGDAIIAPPAVIGGHVTHHAPGAAGLYGLRVHPAPVDAAGFSVDPAGLRALAREVRPALITLGGSLNLFPHPVAAAREIADAVGARLLFDAAHLSGPIAGGAWPDPLAEGAHLMTMSTYKSLAGPPGGLILTDDAEIAALIAAVAYPGLTANTDAGRTAALAVTLADWKAAGAAHAAAMVALARAFAERLMAAGLPVHAAARGGTRSHAFALEAACWGGGQAAAKRLRAAGFLASGIGLPVPPVPGDLPGLRLGANELVRWGVTAADLPEIASLFVRALTEDEPARLAPGTARLRAGFDRLNFLAEAA